MSASQDDDDGKTAWFLASPPPTLRIQPLTDEEVMAESEEEMRRFDEFDVGR